MGVIGIVLLAGGISMIVITWRYLLIEWLVSLGTLTAGIGFILITVQYGGC